MSTENAIQVTMLGGCSLSYCGVTLDGNSVRSKRIWTLLEYLISYRFRCIPQDELFDLLYGEDKSSTPDGALKTLVHRAREALSKLGLADGKEIILKCAGGYRWNPAIALELDTERFEGLLRDASLSTADAEKQLGLRLEALKLYRGDFLPEASADIWAMSTNTYFHYRYMTAVNETLETLIGRKRYDEAMSVAERAIALDPYTESLYFNLILALINTNRLQAAREQYESMERLFYGEFGAAPSNEMQAVYKQLLKQETGAEKSMAAVKDELIGSDGGNGAFYCEYEIFRDIVKREMVSAKRSGGAVHIGLISTDEKEGRQLTPKTRETAMRRLRACIGSGIRGSDVFSRCSVSQYVVLLPSTDAEGCEQLLERVIKKYRRENPHSPARVCFSLQKVEPREA